MSAKHTPEEVDRAIRAAAKRGAALRRTPGMKQRLPCGCEIRLGVESMSLVHCHPHAAAPELLEALEEHLRWYDGGPAGRAVDEDALIARTRAAIAKAKGAP